MFSKMMDPDSGLNKFCDLIIGVFVTGFLTIIFSLPIVTMSTAITAGYYTAAKVVRQHEGYLWREFISAFKKNFKTGFGLGLCYLIAAVILLYDYYYLKNSTEKFSDIMILIIITVCVMFFITYFFSFFELSRFDKNGFQIFKFAIVTSFRHFPSALAIVGMFALSIFMAWLMPVGFCLFPGFAFWGSTFVMEKVMKKYMPVPEPGSPEAEKWYYR